MEEVIRLLLVGFKKMCRNVTHQHSSCGETPSYSLGGGGRGPGESPYLVFVFMETTVLRCDTNP